MTSRGVYSEQDALVITMIKNTPKKSSPRGKHGARRNATDNRPIEFDRGWTELESQHDRIKMDWSSLAAQLGISNSDERDPEIDSAEF